MTPVSGHLGNGTPKGEIRLPDDPVDLEEISPADVLLGLPEGVRGQMAVTLATTGSSWDRLERVSLSKTTQNDHGLGERSLVVRGGYGAIWRIRTRPEQGDVRLERLEDHQWTPNEERNTWTPAGIVRELRVLSPKRYDHVFLYEQRVDERRPWNDIASDVAGGDSRGGTLAEYADELGFHELQTQSNTAYRTLADAEPDDFGTPFPSGEGSDA